MQQPALGGIYSPHTPKEPLGKADRIPERRLIRRSSFVITGSTGECFFPATSRYCSNGYLINCTDALEIIVGLTGECKLRNPQKMESLDNCTDAHVSFITGSTGASRSSFTSSHCTDELSSGIVGSFGAKP